ncbi:acyl-[acyl-carrier-protein]-phospholipid O-acyltransferase/long-chain-fatty-acid--[acyl-carrier-protein] ligase [Aureimonas pseudogalii]|uniref:Acyl-[acyl-carrier-protein]-phospholipid O-acyltransferase/long-chain-fatty-acid--[acyl-carrier-protein] ligase n=2 Tax=Aureimonas pseudogalii TaxID=1744844 RepID=A0A7W6MLX9_9HYPH|nr:acyl-[acyl-carrier-protein]-phospholipid O-acyltransferase/long-chain-fatty-acid--[acyl-carrier-protein] ligase [Aureimonas pseudogalii]
MVLSARFAPLFWTQFLTAFNDNLLKNALVFLILFRVSAEGAAPLVALCGAIFILPFLLLSGLGGELADRHDKALVARRLKLAEIAVAALGATGLLLGSIPVMMVALAGFGVGSALFGPIKYGILPDLLPASELPTANAWVEGATFAAILGGTLLAGLLAAGSPVVPGALMLALAVAGWLTARRIPATGPAAPELRIEPNVLRSTAGLVSGLRTDRRVFAASLMVSWFWAVGAVLLSLLPVIVTGTLGGSEAMVSAVLALFAVAVAIGSGLAAWICRGRIVLLPAPLAALAMAGFGLDLAFALSGDPSTTRALVDFTGMAFASAFLVVPTFAAVQAWAPAASRARTVAGANALSAGFMVAGGIALALVQAAGLPLPGILAALALLNLGAAVLMLRKLPTNPVRDAASLYFRIFHRMEVEGLANLDAAGPNPILVLNHASFLDAPLALALTERDPVFAIDHVTATRPWVKPFLRFVRALPLDPSRPISTRTLIKAAEAGEPLVIFPEGRITVTGSLMKLYDGAAMVAARTGAPVVPIRIEGLERSYFSRLGDGQVRRSLFPKVRVTILPPERIGVPEGGTARARRALAGAQLGRVMSGLVFRTERTDLTILEKITAQARRDGLGRLALEDPVTGAMTYGTLLTAARVLSARFALMFPNEPHLGLMLPNANGTVATFLGLVSAGKVPAMINFTAGAANIRAACRAAETRTILSSRAFVERAKLQPLVDELSTDHVFVWLEDVRASLGTLEKLRGRLARSRPLAKRDADDPAAILFTSGSEGAPKGVVLSHRNILVNIAQIAASIDFGAHDKVFNVLPMFHSFGLSAATLLPLVSGVPVYLYPSPLHYRIVPELIYAANATILFGTDTFLAGYARTAHPYDLRSLRYVFAGAEPVKATTRRTYGDRFGIRLFEGYGVTEASPVLALNTAMHNRPGTVGRLLPGIEHRLEPVEGVETGGRLHVRGGNVMLGYLRSDRPGHLERLADGWHDTGDIVSIDADGFVRIEGRAKRFAKIGGEMISLAAVEALAGDLWPGAPSAVVAEPDPRKGERLVLLTQHPAATRADFSAFARSRGASELMVPSQVRIVERLPLLGTGKLDYAALPALLAGLSTPSNDDRPSDVEA